MFTLSATHAQARAGQWSCAGTTLNTPALVVDSPCFAVNPLTSGELQTLGYAAVMLDLMRLWARWGHRVAQPLDLHHFMAWDGLIMGKLAVACESERYTVAILDGQGLFHSQIGGHKWRLSPAAYMRIQCGLGIDIILSYFPWQWQLIHKKNTAIVAELALAWARQCQQMCQNKSSALWASVPMFAENYIQSELMAQLFAMDFAGYAIDSTHLMHTFELWVQQVMATLDTFPQHVPRGLLHIQTLPQLIMAIYAGADIVYSDLPQRLAQQGLWLTAQGVKQSQHRPVAHRRNCAIDAACGCYTCSHFSWDYLHHLHNSNIMLGKRLNVIHNHFFCERLMFCLRVRIVQGKMPSWPVDLSQFLDETVGHCLG